MTLPALVALIIGGLIGAAASDGFGALGGAALGWLLLRSFRQERAIASLQRSLRDAESPAEPRTAPVAAAVPEPVRLRPDPVRIPEADPAPVSPPHDSSHLRRRPGLALADRRIDRRRIPLQHGHGM